MIRHDGILTLMQWRREPLLGHGKSLGVRLAKNVGSVREELCGKQIKCGSYDEGAEVSSIVLQRFSSVKWFTYSLG